MSVKIQVSCTPHGLHSVGEDLRVHRTTPLLISLLNFRNVQYRLVQSFHLCQVSQALGSLVGVLYAFLSAVTSLYLLGVALGHEPNLTQT